MRRYGPMAALLAAVPLLAFGPGERAAPTRWALLVGIDDYINFDVKEGGDLLGAEADARLMRATLVDRGGFPEQNVRMLLNGDATQAAIKAGITEWLASNAHPGDNVTIFFAGRSSQVWDEDDDEDDGLDETLAPADVLPDSPARDITDDMLAGWLAGLPTDNVVLILDTGTGVSEVRPQTTFFRSRRLGRETRDLPRPGTASRRAIPGQKDESGFDLDGAKVLELAASSPAEAAVEVYFPGTGGAPGFYGGAFTTFLAREMWKAPEDLSYLDVVTGVAEALKRNRFQQRPYLSDAVALRSTPLFHVEGTGERTPTASLAVRSVSGASAVLEGGGALGITTGSVFETEGGAALRVESADATSITTVVMEGRPRQGERATLIGYRYVPDPLRVNVAGVDTLIVSRLTRVLDEEAGVELLQDADAFSHLVVRRRGNELTVLGPDGFVRHDAMAVNATGAVELAARLRQEAAAKRLADTDNPAQSFQVRLTLEAGKTDFGVGEIVSFHVTSDRDGYLTLLDLGTDGNIVMLLPNAYEAPVRIQAGRPVSFPGRDMGFQLEVFPPLGRRMVRAFVTTTPLDLPVRGEYTVGDERFADAVADAVQRSAGVVGGAVRLDTWGTASLVYDIHN